MGNNIASGYRLYMYPDVTPAPHTKPTFDPLYGFPEGREQKEMIATEEEMISMKIPLNYRGFCAHKLIEYKKCRHENWPFPVRCHHERHAYEKCEFEELVDRMKDYERERRLLARQKRLDAKASAA